MTNFGKNVDYLLDEVTFRHSIEKLLAAFRETIEDDTATTEAIDDQKPMKEIAVLADDDGYAEFAQILRMLP